MGIHNEAQLDRKFLELAKLMNIYLNHFPSHEKYGLALTIRQKAYEMYGYMVEAQKRYYKKTALTNLDICHEQLRMYVRLAHEMGYLGFKNGKREDQSTETAEHRYLAITRLVDEMGRMIGGWIVSQMPQQEAS